MVSPPCAVPVAKLWLTCAGMPGMPCQMLCPAPGPGAPENAQVQRPQRRPARRFLPASDPCPPPRQARDFFAFTTAFSPGKSISPASCRCRLPSCKIFKTTYCVPRLSGQLPLRSSIENQARHTLFCRDLGEFSPGSAAATAPSCPLRRTTGRCGGCAFNALSRCSSMAGPGKEPSCVRLHDRLQGRRFHEFCHECFHEHLP